MRRKLPRKPRIAWREGVGWVIKTDVPLSEPEMNRVLDWAREYYSRKLIELPPGREKDLLKANIKYLDHLVFEEITQRL